MKRKYAIIYELRRIVATEQFHDIMIKNITFAEEVMEPNKVVLKFKNNTMKKGTTRDFFPNKTQFHLEEMNREIVEVSIEDLKAIFFVKDFEGNKNHQYNYDDEIAGGGKKIKVRFIDGETMVGYTLGYSPDRQGFYLTSADLQGNNERIFVVKSATEKVEFL